MFKTAALLLAVPLMAQVPQLFLRPTNPVVQAGVPVVFTFSYPGTFYGGALINIGPLDNGQPNSCLFRYVIADSSLSLLDDAAGTWSDPAVVGSVAVLSNSQCAIDVHKSSVTVGNDGINIITTAKVSVTFASYGSYFTNVAALGFGGRRIIDYWRQVGTVLVLPSVAPVVQPPTVIPVVTVDTEEAAFLVAINTFRAQNGVGPLQVDTRLQASSYWMSNDMATNNYFSHTDSTGRTPDTRISAFGYSTATAWWGENIAAGNASAQGTFGQWVNSPGHRSNMLSPNFNIIGISRAYSPTAQYGWYWVTDFGAR